MQSLDAGDKEIFGKRGVRPFMFTKDEQTLITDFFGDQHPKSLIHIGHFSTQSPLSLSVLSVLTFS